MGHLFYESVTKLYGYIDYFDLYRLVASRKRSHLLDQIDQSMLYHSGNDPAAQGIKSEINPDIRFRGERSNERKTGFAPGPRG